ncbi:MAG: RidA family protein [Demequina sp.]|nr:RidA family protein [Demequina sp.]
MTDNSARQNLPSGGRFEDVYGYSRAVRVGNQIAVAGSCCRDTAIDGDAYEQSKDAFAVIEGALKQAGAGLEHVIRTVTFVTDIADMDLVARAHREAFDAIRPVATIVQVAALADPRYKVEIQVDAIVA